MSSSLLTASALLEALRGVYHQGEMTLKVEYLMKNLFIGKYRVLIKKKFNTACWVPPAGSQDSHSIYYGDLMLERSIDFFMKTEKINMPSQKNDENSLDKKVEYLKETLDAEKLKTFYAFLVKVVFAYGRHEREHARNTDPDLKGISRTLKSAKIPFSYFNIFEDARIEAISRNTMRGVKFDWDQLEEAPGMQNPLSLFFRCIYLEGQEDAEAIANQEPLAKNPESTVSATALRVREYYTQAINCPTSPDLIPIIREFMREFKEDLPDPDESDKKKGDGGSDGKGGDGDEGDGAESEDTGNSSSSKSSRARERAGDLSAAAEAADKGDEFFQEFEKDAQVVIEGESDENKKSNKKVTMKQGIPGSLDPIDSGNEAAPEHYLSDLPGKLDDIYKNRVTDLTKKLMQLFKSNSLPAVLETPGRRISGRHLVRDELKFIHKKSLGGKSKRKYTVIYDCSGSMSGRPDREGKLFLLALNNLAKMGYLTGKLILSGWITKDGKNVPGWLKYNFPVDDEIILRIDPACPGEGLHPTLKDNLAEIKGMDDVFVYTDASICDAPIDKNYFAKNRIWPVGLYAGNKESALSMAEHFPQNIIKPTIEEVVNSMLIRNKRSM